MTLLCSVMEGVLAGGTRVALARHKQPLGGSTEESATGNNAIGARRPWSRASTGTTRVSLVKARRGEARTQPQRPIGRVGRRWRIPWKLWRAPRERRGGFPAVHGARDANFATVIKIWGEGGRKIGRGFSIVWKFRKLLIIAARLSRFFYDFLEEW